MITAVGSSARASPMGYSTLCKVKKVCSACLDSGGGARQCRFLLLKCVQTDLKAEKVKRCIIGFSNAFSIIGGLKGWEEY